jgi:hypothetical protein
MTTLMIVFAAMTVGAAVGFLTARLICGTASSVQRSPYMSSRADMYRQRTADAKERAAQAKDPSRLAGRKSPPQITFSGFSLETANEHCRPSKDISPRTPALGGPRTAPKCPMGCNLR